MPSVARLWLLPLFVLLVGAASTALVNYGLQRTIDAQDAERFEAAAERVHQAICEPLEARNAAAIGSDMFTEPTRSLPRVRPSAPHDAGGSIVAESGVWRQQCRVRRAWVVTRFTQC